LQDFGLTDLFQVLGQQQKTGVLNLQGEKKSVQVLFDKGMVVGTAFPSETGDENPLGRRLIRGGLISQENWKKAGQLQKEKGGSLARVLVESGWVSREDLSAALRLLTVDTIYSLFKWKAGTFQFEAEEVSYDPEFIEPINSEFLLLDVLRMVDEWPMIAERIPTFDQVLQRTHPLATLDALTGTPWEKSRTFQMEVIYDLIDGQRTIKQIIELSFLEEFETCKNLLVLMDAGLVEGSTVVPEKTGGRIRLPSFHLPSFGIGRKIHLGKILLNAVAFFLVAVFGLFLISQLVPARGGGFPLGTQEHQSWIAFRDAIKPAEEKKIANARAIFYLEENHYPLHLEEMVKKGLLTR
jgi:hypothetical protein